MPFPQALSERCVRSVKRKSTEGKKRERDREMVGRVRHRTHFNAHIAY